MACLMCGANAEKLVDVTDMTMWIICLWKERRRLNSFLCTHVLALRNTSADVEQDDFGVRALLLVGCSLISLHFVHLVCSGVTGAPSIKSCLGSSNWTRDLPPQ